MSAMVSRRDQTGEREGTTVERPRLERSVPSAAFVVRVAAGIDQGKQLLVDGSLASRALVGKSPTCDLRLSDKQVSRRHAAFEITGDTLQVTDLQSMNGTRVNGVAVTGAYLEGGEQVDVGETRLLVERREGKQVALPAATSFGRILGASAEMRKLYPACARLADCEIPVVIEGETGTGKELLAEALHETGPRASAPFIVFDCTSLPPSLIDSALFGHERGAFTGAVDAREGVFEQAAGGTLLIDEIGDLDIALQAKLLRAIERSEVQRLGSNRWVRVNVRVVAATRRDLEHEIQCGRFRDDLFFRLAVARLELPPLRKRKGDIALLARHFWSLLAGTSEPLDQAFITRLEDYGWPGNVRELHNTIARRRVFGPDVGVGLAGDASASRGAVDDALERILSRDLPLPQARQLLGDELERRYVERILARHGGNVTRAAAASGLALRYFKLLRARTTK